MSSDVPSVHSVSPSATADAAAPSAPPGFDLGPGLRAAPFAPGRFATVIQRSQSGTHALQLVREDSTASFTLDLATDGSARACHGWRYTMTNDGPKVHTEDRFREQAGFRGQYVEGAGVVEIRLMSDDEVCAPVSESARVRPRATALTLRCVLAVPEGHPTLTRPVLVCQWTSEPATARAAHVIAELGPANAMVLGAAPGLRVKLAGGLPNMKSTQPAATTATVGAVDDDAWMTGF